MRKNFFYSLRLVSVFILSKRLKYVLLLATIFYVILVTTNRQPATKPLIERPSSQLPSTKEALDSDGQLTEGHLEKIYWDVDVKLRNILENLEHRLDYISSKARGAKAHFNGVFHYHGFNSQFDQLGDSRKKGTK